MNIRLFVVAFVLAALILVLSAFSGYQQPVLAATGEPTAGAAPGQRFGARPRGVIVFVSDRSGQYEIYSMKADGSSKEQLTRTKCSEWTPVLSPDGTKIAYASDNGSCDNYDIFVMNIDGSDPVRLTDTEFNNYWITWSPDGEKIAFASNQDGDFEIFVMNTDGSNLEQLTDNNTLDKDPAWSPDGEFIAYTAQDTSEQFDVFIMNADGSDQRSLTTVERNDFTPVWMPEGSLSFYSSDGTDFGLYAMQPDGSEVELLFKIGGSTYAWSPDAKYMVYSKQRYIDGKWSDQYDLIIRDVQTGAEFKLTDDGSQNLYPTWTQEN